MKKPNVVFIFADQWRASAVGYAGDKNVKTPNIDMLKEESINFSNAISGCPICTPYRASLLTGQYPLTTGLFTNDLCLSNDSVSLAQAYSQAGYDTAYIGKWHLDGHGRATFIPKERRQGFDYWKVLECTHAYNNSLYYDGDMEETKIWEGYDAYAQTNDAINYLQNRMEKDSPFLLMVSYGVPHNPYHIAPKDLVDLYPTDKLTVQPNVNKECEEKAKEFLQGYYAHISALDLCVGQISKTIDDLGMKENTIFILTSDHGDSVMSHCTLEIGNCNKQRPYDESVKVPFLLRYPGKFGTESKEITTPFATPDIMPTLLDISEIKIPDSVEGISFSPELLGIEKIDRNAVLIASYVPFNDWTPEKGGREYRGVRTERYTYTKDLSGPWLLFDNYKDPFQLNNLINHPEYQEVQKELEKSLDNILTEQGDEFLPWKELCENWGYHDLCDDNSPKNEKGEEWYEKVKKLRKINKK